MRCEEMNILMGTLDWTATDPAEQQEAHALLDQPVAWNHAEMERSRRASREQFMASPDGRLGSADASIRQTTASDRKGGHVGRRQGFWAREG
jgi:hypothetical protein